MRAGGVASLAPLLAEVTLGLPNMGDLGVLAWVTACGLGVVIALQCKNAVGHRRESESELL